MRKLGSLLVILLLITAYGRCVADQLGVLHTTGSSCCQVLCDQADHCNTQSSPCEESPSTASNGGHPQDHNHDSHSDHSDESEPDESQPNKTDPCGLCIILSSDGMLLSDDIKVPTPILLELSPIFFITSLHGLLDKSRLFTHLDDSPPEHPDPPAEHRSQLRRIIAKTAPVRGPSIV